MTDDIAPKDTAPLDTALRDTAPQDFTPDETVPPEGTPRCCVPGPPGETVVAVRGADRDDLAVTLDTVAIAAGRLSGSGLRDFARELGACPDRQDLRARAAIVAGEPAQLAERARSAAAALRAAGPAPVRAWPQPGTDTAGPGVYLSENAAGRVALLFPGLVGTPVEHSAVLSASIATLAAAARLGIEPCAGVGYSFGEVTALAWAGVITFGEAGRLAAHRARIISAAPGRAAMARVFANPAVAEWLCAGTGLSVAARESPAQHVLAGPASDFRDLARRAGALGAELDVMTTTRALHTPAMLPAVPPLRAAAEGLRCAAPRRRVVSSVTGLEVAADEDIAGLLATQLARPVLLADALSRALEDADLVLLTARDPALARAAAACCRVPVLQPPVGPGAPIPAPALASLFAAGAIATIAMTGAADGPGAPVSAWSGGQGQDRSEGISQGRELAARA